MRLLLLALLFFAFDVAGFAQSGAPGGWNGRSNGYDPTAIPGTATNDSAAAGYVGEVISSTVASGAPVSLTSTTAANMTSVSLTAGDWEVFCNAYHNLAATTTITLMQTGISTTTATLPAATGGTTDLSVWRQASAAPGGLVTQEVGPHRMSLSATTTVYCVANDTFGTSTDVVYGTLKARRAR